MTETETRRILATLKAAFPAATILDQTAQVYALGLADVPYAAANAALPELIRTHRLSTLPTPAEIRAATGMGRGLDRERYRRYAQLRNDPAPNPADDAEYRALEAGR